jgi:hypothetical protein
MGDTRLPWKYFATVSLARGVTVSIVFFPPLDFTFEAVPNYSAQSTFMPSTRLIFYL